MNSQTAHSLPQHINNILAELNHECSEESSFRAYRPTLHTMMKQITSSTPELLLYGNYNAGKSTLINLLTSSQQAQVGDIPTTAGINSYEWNNALLLDSPGVNAPIEHEKVTADHIHQADLVIFVIRSGDVDEIGLYQNIAEMLKQQKQLFIVLNCDSSQKAHVADWQSRLCDNLLNQLVSAGVPEEQITQIPVTPVNLLTAGQAVEQNNLQMQAICGYAMLAARLTKWVSDHHQQHAHLAGIISRIDNQIFKPILAGLQEGKNSDLDELNQTDARLQQQQTTLLTQAGLELNRRISLQRPSLYFSLRQPDAQIKISQLIDELVTGMHEWLQSKFEQHSPEQLVAWAEINENQTNDNQHDPDWLHAVLPHLNETTLQTGMNCLKKIGIPLFKSMDSKTLTLLSKRLNVGIQILFGGYEIYSAYQQERRQQESLRQEALQLTQQVNSISDNLYNQLHEQLTTLFDGVFASEQQKLNQKRELILAQSTLNARQHQRFTSLVMRLRGLQEMLPATGSNSSVQP